MGSQAICREEMLPAGVTLAEQGHSSLSGGFKNGWFVVVRGAVSMHTDAAGGIGGGGGGGGGGNDGGKAHDGFGSLAAVAAAAQANSRHGKDYTALRLGRLHAWHGMEAAREHDIVLSAGAVVGFEEQLLEVCERAAGFRVPKSSMCASERGRSQERAGFPRGGRSVQRLRLLPGCAEAECAVYTLPECAVYSSKARI